MTADTVDVLLATCNGGKYLGEQLASVAGQQFERWRLIVRDDRSTDDTCSLLSEFRRKYPTKVLLLEDAEGRLGAAANFGMLMQNSSAEYVALCDQDDVWEADKLLVLRDAFLNQSYEIKLPMLVHSDLTLIDPAGRRISRSLWKTQNINPKRSRLNQLLIQNVVTGCASMANRALIQFATPVPSTIIMHDWWVALMAAAHGKIHYIPRPTVLYRQHEENTIGAQRYGVERWARRLKEELLGSGSARQQTSRARAQAAALLQHRLPLAPELHDMVYTFYRTDTACYARRLQILVRYRILKSGFLRNVGLLAVS